MDKTPKPPKELRKPSEKKSSIASTRPRVNGKFVSKADEEGLASTERKKKGKAKKEDVMVDTRQIPEDIKSYIGSDSKKFFEMALQHALTWYDGYRYAKELKSLQHPSLASIEQRTEVEVTRKQLTWSWDEQSTPAALNHVIDVKHEDDDRNS